MVRLQSVRKLPYTLKENAYEEITFFFQYFKNPELCKCSHKKNQQSTLHEQQNHDHGKINRNMAKGKTLAQISKVYEVM